MIRDLDDTIEQLFVTRAPAGSELSGADISFDLPDADWRGGLDTLTVNCYLYDIRENVEFENRRAAGPALGRRHPGHPAPRPRPHRLRLLHHRLESRDQ